MKNIKNVLDLFQSVPLSTSDESADINIEYGVIIQTTALKYKEEIVRYLEESMLNGNDLNKSFHKSWENIILSTEEELVYHQIFHYLSTYGSDFKDDIYIPLEELDIPFKLNFKVIKGISKEEIIKRQRITLNSYDSTLKQIMVKLNLYSVPELIHYANNHK